MNFTVKKIRHRNLKIEYARKNDYVKNKGNLKNRKFTAYLLRFLLIITLFFILSLFLFGIFLYKKYIVNLPSISELENLEIAESSTIYDRNGVELYKVYKEKRTYIPYENISKNMVNALVAGEDKRYWDNPGIDLIGIARAVIYRVIGRSEKIEGTSTITQQLIRNTILSNDRKIERKIKELYLAYKLTNGISKEKILELYLNKIEFGSNAFGVEQASRTFFDKKAKELGILEASILASLPKGPTYYSPYNNADRLLGYPYTYNSEHPSDITKILLENDKIVNKDLLDKFENFFNNLKASKISGTDKLLICGLVKENFKINISIDKDGCSIFEYTELLSFLNGIKINIDSDYIEYQTGRKDFILGRMLEDGYIKFDEYKESILKAIAYKFEIVKEDIKAPHFVFFVKEYLEEKYGKDVISMGGLKIYTTLDYELQKKAEEIIKGYSVTNKEKFLASNAALVSLDNNTGDIIAMVGGLDYFDTDAKGNVNIVTSKLQPGSSFKPFVYSLAIYNNEIGSKTPIYDLPTKFPGYTPKNFDGDFMGKMDITTALNNSRNIPAVKMFYLAGGEKNIVNFMHKLGVKSLKDTGNYGSSLALGTGEMTPLELASAYSVFANMGEKKEISPIFEIIDAKGNIIKERTEKKGNKIISEGQSYIINTILSETSSRPDYWNKFLSLNGLQVAAKTGTSTKQYTKKGGGKVIFPRNLWTAGYTKDITTVVWVGNTNGDELGMKADGLNVAGPIWRDFMTFVHKGKKVTKWVKPSNVKEKTISTISGLPLEIADKDNKFLTTSLFLNSPTKFDNSFKTVEVDALCDGKITPETPVAAIKKVTLLEFHSLNPSNKNWEDPVSTWAVSDEAKELYGNVPDLITTLNNTPCERKSKSDEIIIKSNINNEDTFVSGENFIELAYKSVNPIIKIDILINEKRIDEIKLKGKTIGTYVGTFNIPSVYANSKVNLVLRAVDNSYFSFDEVKSINIVGKDTIAPIIKITSPSDLSVKVYKNSFFILKGKVSDNSSIRTINIYIDGKTEKIGIQERNFEYSISGEKLDVGIHTIRIEAIDKGFNIGKEEVKIEVIEN